MVLEVHNKLRKKNRCEKDIIILEVELIILLCGFMGSGKSFLMESLHKNSKGKGSFFDLDDEVFDKFGAGEDSLSDLIEKKGWDFFRVGTRVVHHTTTSFWTTSTRPVVG